MFLKVGLWGAQSTSLQNWTGREKYEGARWARCGGLPI